MAESSNMEECTGNEFSDSKRAKDDEHDLFAAIGKQVLGLELKDGDDSEEDDRVKVVQEIESLCMSCEEQGMTRLLLTKVPFFREIILSSFYCEHCHYKNTEIDSAGEIQDQGCKYTFKIDKQSDLQRQIVKSDKATIYVEELDMQMPAGKGRLSNAEGFMKDVVYDLSDGQEDRKKRSPDTYEKLQAVIEKTERLIEDAKFTFILDDPSGNSWIEPAAPNANEPADKLSQKKYDRTTEQNQALGLSNESAGTLEAVPVIDGGMEDVDILEGENYTLPIVCPGCTNEAVLLLQMVNIPHFKQVVINTTNCNSCGYRVTDVKTGGEVPEKGKRVTVKIRGPEDLGRDILKGEACFLKVPECKIEVVAGTMGGRFTTVEGLLTNIRDDLRGAVFDTNAEELPDSMPNEKKRGWLEFFGQLDKAIKAEIEFTIIMEDPLGGSYCEGNGAPGEDDQVIYEDYERTAEEEDELGLTDMKTHRNEDGEYVNEMEAKKKSASDKAGEKDISAEQTKKADGGEEL